MADRPPTSIESGRKLSSSLVFFIAHARTEPHPLLTLRIVFHELSRFVWWRFLILERKIKEHSNVREASSKLVLVILPFRNVVCYYNGDPQTAENYCGSAKDRIESESNQGVWGRKRTENLRRENSARRSPRHRSAGQPKPVQREKLLYFNLEQRCIQTRVP